jgi:glutamyl-tRNA synthetase
MVSFLVVDEPEVDEASWTKAISKGRNVAEMLDATIERIEALPEAAWQPEAVQAAVSEAAIAAGLVNAEGKPQLSKAQGPVRVALTGRTVGLPLWESIVALGRPRTLERLRTTRKAVG